MLDLPSQFVDSVLWTPLQKQETKNIDGARLLPLRSLSQFFAGEEKINCLGNEFSVRKSAYLSPMGWTGIYNG